MRSHRLSRIVLGSVLTGALLVAAACSGGGGSKGPGFTDLSQLNAVWTLNGTYSFTCNGAPENVAINAAKVWIFNGQFNTTLPWPTSVCGSNGILFQGAVGIDGSISGTVATNGGGSTLSDTLAGSCSASACKGSTPSTGEFTFTMTNTGTNPFDGSAWNANVGCATGGGTGLTNLTISQGQYSGSAQIYVICASGSTVTPAQAPVAGTFTLSVMSNGALSASLVQGTSDTLSFSSTMTGITDSGTITGTNNATFRLVRPTPQS